MTKRNKYGKDRSFATDSLCNGIDTSGRHVYWTKKVFYINKGERSENQFLIEHR